MRREMRRKAFGLLMLSGMLLLPLQGCRGNPQSAEKIRPGQEETLDQSQVSDPEELSGQGEEPDLKETAGQGVLAEKDTADSSSLRDQVLEVGMVLDCSNPYTVVVFEEFCREAEKCDTPIVVELHDSNSSYEKQEQQLEWLIQHGMDILLVDVGTTKEQEKLGEDIRSLGYPTLYFGLRPEKLKEELENSYIGLTQEEQRELEQTLEQERFEESGFRQRAQEDGRKLMERVWEEL